MTCYKVTTERDPLKLRSECDTTNSQNIIAKMPIGTIVSENLVLNAQSGWVAVNYGSQSGFASRSYLTLCDEKGNLLEPIQNDSNRSKNNSTKDSTVVIVDREENQTTTSGEGVSKVMIAGVASVSIGALLYLFL